MEDVLPLLNGYCTFKTTDGTEHEINTKWDMIIAFPPCTHLCCAGQRWFTEGKKPRSLQVEAIDFFMKFVNADCEKKKKIAIENPVGIMSTKYRKPNQIINPYQFGSTECKKKNLFVVERIAKPPTYGYMSSGETDNKYMESYFQWETVCLE